MVGYLLWSIAAAGGSTGRRICWTVVEVVYILLSSVAHVESTGSRMWMCVVWFVHPPGRRNCQKCSASSDAVVWDTSTLCPVECSRKC